MRGCAVSSGRVPALLLPMLSSKVRSPKSLPVVMDPVEQRYDVDDESFTTAR